MVFHVTILGMACNFTCDASVARYHKAKVNGNICCLAALRVGVAGYCPHRGCIYEVKTDWSLCIGGGRERVQDNGNNSCPPALIFNSHPHSLSSAIRTLFFLSVFQVEIECCDSTT